MQMKQSVEHFVVLRCPELNAYTALTVYTKRPLLNLLEDAIVRTDLLAVEKEVTSKEMRHISIQFWDEDACDFALHEMARQADVSVDEMRETLNIQEGDVYLTDPFLELDVIRLERERSAMVHGRINYVTHLLFVMTHKGKEYRIHNSVPLRVN